ENFVRKVVNHDWTVKVGDRRICVVPFPDESPPTLGVHRFGFGARVPEIDSAQRFAVLRQEVILAKKAGYALIVRGSAQERSSRLFACDRLWQLKRGDNGDHGNCRSMFDNDVHLDRNVIAAVTNKMSLDAICSICRSGSAMQPAAARF